MTRQTSFWDRRRAAVQAEAEAEARAVRARDDAAEQAALAECSDTELLERFDLPDPDDLKRGDDFTAFMAKAIPAHLRNRALRKLWVSDPALACLDDLVDYADDYTQASSVTNFTTSYEVGKGLRRHVEKLARKAVEQSDEVPSGEATAEEAEALALSEQSTGTEAAAAEDISVANADSAETEEPQAPSEAVELADATEEAPRPAPRRMTFHYGENGT